VESGEFIYCVGGLTGANTVTDATDAVYYAPISSSGIGSWTSTTSYPTTIRSETCVTSAGSIYCIGGYTNSTLMDSVYYAPLSSSGVGPWTNTTSFPFPVWLTSCVVYSGAIYCVGGGTSASSLSSSDSVYFAPLTSSGVGQWSSATSYPVAVKQQSCVSYSNDIYCVGGYDSTSVYYAAVSVRGVGPWTNTTGYPFTIGANLLSCVTMGQQVFCVGGHTGSQVSSDVYYANLSSSGVGGWTSATNYPVAVFGESCVTSGVRIYCLGGETASGEIVNDTYSS
jgi:N-acetylneuraminic acid mutarotase